MSEEWIKEQLYLKYKHEFAHLKHFKDLPIDLTTYILSFVNLKDIKNVILTCKLFYQCMKKPHFWSRHIENAFREKKDGLKYMKYFSTFKSPVEERLRDQLSFVFNHDLLYIEVFDDGTVQINRKGKYGFSLSYHLNSDMSLNRYGICRLDYENTFMVGYKNIFECPNNVKWLSWSIINWGEPGVGKLKYLDFGTYEGEIARKKTDYEAHGSGKWIFHDGTILEGEGVAWYGEPRKPLKKLKKNE